MKSAIGDLQEKKRLEEALLELQRVNESMLAAMDSAKSGNKEGQPVFSISADSVQLLGEIRSRQRAYCAITGLEHASSNTSSIVRPLPLFMLPFH